jgi:hypothetical protein
MDGMKVIAEPVAVDLLRAALLIASSQRRSKVVELAVADLYANGYTLIRTSMEGTIDLSVT